MRRNFNLLVALGTLVLVLVTVVGVQKLRHGRRGRALQSELAAVPERVPEPPKGVSPQDNPGARSVMEAIATGKHPERLSPLIAPQAFDRKAWEADPQGYLDIVEPARCYQTARSDSGAPALDPASPSWSTLRAGETTLLMVMGTPNAPVTFTAFDGGTFKENGLGSVTVRGDARGYASVHFTTQATDSGPHTVLAGSPLAVGNQRLFVEVLPNATAEN